MDKTRLHRFQAQGPPNGALAFAVLALLSAQSAVCFRELAAAEAAMFLLGAYTLFAIALLLVFHTPRASLLAALVVLAGVLLLQAQLPGPYEKHSFAALSAKAADRSLNFQLIGKALDNPVQTSSTTIRFPVAGTLEDVQGRFMIDSISLPWLPTATVEKGDHVNLLVRPKVFRRTGMQERRLLLELSPESPFSYTQYLLRRGITGTLTVTGINSVAAPAGFRSPKLKLARSVVERFGATDATAVLLASVLGLNGLLSEDLQELFRRTGTMHLLVVSGFHVAVIFAFTAALCSFIHRRSELLLILVPAGAAAPFAALFLTSLYVLLVGGMLTTVRSFLVLAVFALGSALDRRADGMRTLLLAFAAVLLVWPGSQFEAGCELTFAALFGLKLAERWLALLAPQRGLAAVLGAQRAARRLLFFRFAFSPFLSCCGAALGTAPVLLLWFQNTVLLSPVINLAAIPFFSFLCLAAGGICLLLYSCSVPGAEPLISLVLGSIDLFLAFLKQSLRFAGQSEFSPGVSAGAAALIFLVFLGLWITADLLSAARSVSSDPQAGTPLARA